MDHLIQNAHRFADVKEWFFRLGGLLCVISSLILAIILSSSHYWRLWELDDNTVQFVSFGLWEAYYPQVINGSGCVTRLLVHTPIDSTWTKSSILQYSQVLIVWAIMMKTIVLIIISVALKISCFRNRFVEIQLFCYKISALILCVSSFCTFISVSLNYLGDFYGKHTFEFPPDFPIKKQALIRKHFTPVFPLGVLTATTSLLGVLMFLYEMSFLTLRRQVKVKYASKVADQEA